MVAYFGMEQLPQEDRKTEHIHLLAMLLLLVEQL